MNENKELIDCIVNAIQDKKGRGIRIADISKIDDTICDCLVICEGNTPTQVAAISENVREAVRETLALRPSATDGLRNSLWVAMDYTDVVVHIFEPEARAFYDVDNLWEDAETTVVPDLD